MTDRNLPPKGAHGLEEPDASHERPVIDPRRCVHGLVVEASCRACVAVCPRSAWVMDEDSLGLDTAACDVCGLCVPACPQRAIVLEGPAIAVSPRDPERALLACEVAVPEPGPGVVACVHAVGLDELALLYADGVRQLYVARGDCGLCERGRQPLFDQALAGVDRLLRANGLQGLSVVELNREGWTSKRDSLTQHTRRSLFTALRKQFERPSAGSGPRRTAARLISHDGRSAELNPFLPTIDSHRCEACDACVKICPHEVITRSQKVGGGGRYEIEPKDCTGCALCVDVCEANAVSLKQWQNGTAQPVELDTKQCASCGNLFSFVQGREEKPRLCRICLATGHNRKLFQVI